MFQIKETLYGDSKNGSVKQWSVYVDGCKVIVEWGKHGGKLQTKETTCSPKNIGKKNETTAEEQALVEAEAKWTKQYDNKLYRHTAEEASKVGGLLPMLAIDGTKKPDKIKFPCYKQPKLDGVRCTIYLEGGGIKAISRQGKFDDLHTELKEQLLPILTMDGYSKLDGELYIHGEKLQSIVSSVRNTENPLHEKVCFYIFDIPSCKVWEARMLYLKTLIDQSFVKVVQCDVVDTLEEAHLSVQEYMCQGYEGTILRNPQGRYEYNHRSNDLIKLKIMQDSEAFVIGCREDKNGEGVLTCKWGDVAFDVKMKGTHSERAYTEQQKIIGQWINFNYQSLTEDGKPQFPVGNYIRECDSQGNPIV